MTAPLRDAPAAAPGPGAGLTPMRWRSPGSTAALAGSHRMATATRAGERPGAAAVRGRNSDLPERGRARGDAVLPSHALAAGRPFVMARLRHGLGVEEIAAFPTRAGGRPLRLAAA